MIHKLERTQTVPAGISDCWKFFSNPSNLAKITPPGLGFQVMSRVPQEIYEGLMIEYRVRPLFGIATTWLTEITHVRGPGYFVDEQRVGPYAVWHHEHEFHEKGARETVMIDRVHYVLPFSPFSEIVHPLVVAPKLREIFDFRVGAVERIVRGGGLKAEGEVEGEEKLRG